MSDLNAAVAIWLDALEATPVRHRDRMEVSNNLGVALHTRFIHTGVLADLDAAIAAVREALETAADDDPGRATALSSLGIALQTRFDRIGALSDIDAAINAQRAAVEIAPAGEDSRSALTNLASALCSRYRRTRQLTDLNDAIDAAREAAETTPGDHPSWAGRQTNLATALWDRFERTRSTADLDAAAEAAQAAVGATPVGHPERGGFLSNLGIILHNRFEHTGTDADLDAAVNAGQAAIDAASADHPGRAVLLSNLGTSLQARFERAHQVADRRAAASAFAAASKCTSAPPSDRILGARSAAALLAESDRGTAAELLETAVGLLGEVTPRQLRRPDQQHVLGEFAGLASDAAALSLADTDTGTTRQGRAARALRLLEAGRAVLLSQTLGTRDDLTDLRRQHPHLAGKFIALRDQLDQPQDNAAPFIKITDGSTSLATLAQAEDNRGHLAAQLAAVQAEIRTLEGFTTFGLPPSSEELLAQAMSGPIVSFNVSAYRSDALLLTTSGITSVELPGLAQAILIERINAFHQSIHEARDAAAEQPLAETLAWLWDNAAEPVLEALGYRSQPPPGTVWPRVWWAPGGLLGLLPIHAAGHHTEATAGGPAPRTVIDRVISSYTPTIRGLRYVRRPARRDSAHGRALIVAMPTTPGIWGGAPLSSVADEVAEIRKHLSGTVVLAEPDPSIGETSALPTRENVFAQLPACSIAHFACHGVSDSTDPSKSRLLLHDHRTAPLTVASLAAVQHDQLQLVYLSACRTAFNATADLLDEAIHLTSAFQLAGSRNVIGTLWEINDAAAVHMADAFYRNFRTDQAAYALHCAVRALRERYLPYPSRWAAHLHAGA
jgi:tetratricopeptide (TPR) repeat protein